MSAGKPPRSTATRARILVAARQRFAADGYERATIRAIAGDAGIDPALVMRYFGNKEGLLAAAAEFDLRLPDLARVQPGAIGSELVAHFLVRWEGDDTLKALLRASSTNEHAAERMRAIFANQLVPAMKHAGFDGRAAGVRAGLISSQILGFAFCRYVLQLPAIVAMRTPEIVKWLGPVVQRYAEPPVRGG